MGNHRTAKRMPILHSLMSFSGLEPERFMLDWVSASEGERFSRIVSAFVDQVRELGPLNWSENGQSLKADEKEWFAVPSGKQATISGKRSDAEFAKAIQAQAKELLADNAVDCVIGYEVGPRGWTRPAFIYSPEDTDRLVWNQDCTHNLTTYLKDKLAVDSRQPEAEKPRVAVVTKPCDSKAINVLMAEKQIEREQVHVIGVACEGIADCRQHEADRGKRSAGNGKQALQDRCVRCEQRSPVVYDTLIGNANTINFEVAEGLSPSLTQLDKLSPGERMEYWLSEFDRCIRCYACRQSCPMCNCPTCLYERDDSLWVGMNIALNEKRTFHLGRAYHLAGRCIGCDECQRACPVDIPISLLNMKMAQEMQAHYGFQAGMAPVPSPVTTILSGEEV